MIGRRPDPLADAETLIRDVYAYVSYRVPNSSDAQEITSAVFERAVRYRNSYDPRKGTPIAWLIGIARAEIVDGHQRRPSHATLHLLDMAADGDFETSSLERLSLHDAVRSLDPRSRELIALRYGVGLTPRQIAADFGLEENAVNVALHRARERLRAILAKGAQDVG
jgi:RNA polymerase sigma factor (sigma-70 family)